MENKNNKKACFEGLKLAIAKANGEEGLAELIGVSEYAIKNYLYSAKRLPLKHVEKIHKALAIERDLLRPDIYKSEE